MTALPLDLTEDDFMTALRTFLLSVVPVGIECFQGQANRVPTPAAADYIVMTPLGRMRLATNSDQWAVDDAMADTMLISAATQITVQLDIHGPQGSDLAQTISTLTRDYYGCDNIDPEGKIVPLYATDGNQMPFVNAENQYENRWVMNIVMQAAPTISTPQQFASSLAATIKPPIGG